MGVPKGFLLVPVAFRADGTLRTLELTDDDYLKVSIEGGGVTIVGHDILDGDVHDDSVADVVTRGSLIVGNATPKWDELVLGAANQIVKSDGNDLVYTDLVTLFVSLFSKGARVHATASQALADSTVVYIDLDTEVYDTDEIHEGVTNPSRLTCKTAGKYFISCGCCFDTNSTGVRAMGVYVNRTTELMNYQLDANAGGHTRFAGATQYILAVNDYIEMYMWQNSTGALNSLAAGIAYPYLAMQRIG